MSLTEIVSFDKKGEIEATGLRLWVKKLFLGLLIILTAGLSFGVGRLTAPAVVGPIKLETNPNLTSKQPSQTATSIQSINLTGQGGEVVASKNGTKYHYLHCPGAKQIKEENKLFFPSGSSAESSGYTLASNCQPR